MVSSSYLDRSCSKHCLRQDLLVIICSFNLYLSSSCMLSDWFYTVWRLILQNTGRIEHHSLTTLAQNMEVLWLGPQKPVWNAPCPLHLNALWWCSAHWETRDIARGSWSIYTIGGAHCRSPPWDELHHPSHYGTTLEILINSWRGLLHEWPNQF